MSFESKKMEWFVHDRLGLFLHWGLYAMPARHEWVYKLEKLTPEKYHIYFELFNPDLFSAAEWARSAREAGMKYLVVTAKHHEGFCMWDSKHTKFKITNTKIGRDLLREILDAFRNEGLKVGIYYSLIDWSHPDFVIDSLHPLWDLPPKQVDELNLPRDMKRYTQYMRNQVTELLTDYGPLDILWFDFSYTEKWECYQDSRPWVGKGRKDWESEEMLKLVRSLQPEIILNNRLDLSEGWDVTTPEQFTPFKALADKDGHPVAWEGCQTFSGAWGYHRDEYTWKSIDQCIQMLINHVSRNGNLLMNIGPTARGYFDSRAMELLKGFQNWMKFHSRSIYGCGPAEFEEPRDCRYTYNTDTGMLYLHVFTWPFCFLHLPGMAGKIRYAQFLHDGSEVKIRDHKNDYTKMTPDGMLTLELPVRKPDVTVPVIEILLK